VLLLSLSKPSQTNIQWTINSHNNKCPFLLVSHNLCRWLLRWSTSSLYGWIPTKWCLLNLASKQHINNTNRCTGRLNKVKETKMEDNIRENTTIILKIIKISKKLKEIAIILILHLQQITTTILLKETIIISNTTNEETTNITITTTITDNNNSNSTHISMVNMSKPNIQLSNNSNNSLLNNSLRDSTLNSLYLSNKVPNSSNIKINLMSLYNSCLHKEWLLNKCKQKRKIHRYSKNLSSQAWSN